MLSVGAQSQEGLAPVVPVRTPIGGCLLLLAQVGSTSGVGEATFVCLEVMVWRR